MDQIGILCKCWAISEESEELFDCAKENIEECWPAVEAIAKCELPAACWQAYVAAATVGSRAEALLRAALDDLDIYARRRGALSLAVLEPKDSKEIASLLMSQEDRYLRQVAIEFVLVLGDNPFQEKALKKLSSDAEPYVREAARRLL